MMVDRAVIRLAHHREGHIEWAAPYHRLRAGLYDLALCIHTRERTVTVIRIYRGR